MSHSSRVGLTEDHDDRAAAASVLVPAVTDATATLALLKQGLGGLLLLVAGLAVIETARGYGIGTLTEMGAGYFPALLGGALTVVGAIMLAGLAIRAFAMRIRDGDRHAAVSAPNGSSRLLDVLGTVNKAVAWRGGVCIIGSIVAFVVLGQWGGLLPASFAVVFLSALGDRTNTLRRAASIATLMTVICVVVFWWALQLQLPLLAWPR